jgi:hypothetical protein
MKNLARDHPKIGTRGKIFPTVLVTMMLLHRAGGRSEKLGVHTEIKGQNMPL